MHLKIPDALHVCNQVLGKMWRQILPKCFKLIKVIKIKSEYTVACYQVQGKLFILLASCKLDNELSVPPSSKYFTRVMKYLVIRGDAKKQVKVTYMNCWYSKLI